MGTKEFFRSVQFFDNGEDRESQKSARKLAAVGYAVESVPTSGASALVVEGYEVVGRTAIDNVVDQLVKTTRSR